MPSKSFCLVFDLLFDFDADNDPGADNGGAGVRGAHAHGRSVFSPISQKWKYIKP